jgi:hypothetical protein
MNSSAIKGATDRRMGLKVKLRQTGDFSSPPLEEPGVTDPALFCISPKIGSSEI